MTASAILRAELTRDDTCTAIGITAKSPSPVLALCRKLIEAGFEPSIPMEVWRGSTLRLRVRSIGEAAALEIRGDGVGFRPASGLGTAPPIRQKRERVAA